jgi:chorismate mutase
VGVVPFNDKQDASRYNDKTLNEGSDKPSKMRVKRDLHREGGTVHPVLRGIRGATHLERDDEQEMEQAVAELATAMMRANGLSDSSVVSVILTSTPDLVSAFPARAMRLMGWDDVPLLCAQEINVTGAMRQVVRVLIHVITDIPRSQIEHVYLRGTEGLRS